MTTATTTTTTTTTTKAQTAYPGSVASALRRIRRVLDRAGIPRGKVVGRYNAIQGLGTQRTIPGWNAHRVGCGRSVSLTQWGRVGGSDKAELQNVIALLRADGLPVDDRGWMKCQYE